MAIIMISDFKLRVVYSVKGSLDPKHFYGTRVRSLSTLVTNYPTISKKEKKTFKMSCCIFVSLLAPTWSTPPPAPWGSTSPNFPPGK